MRRTFFLLGTLACITSAGAVIHFGPGQPYTNLNDAIWAAAQEEPDDEVEMHGDWLDLLNDVEYSGTVYSTAGFRARIWPHAFISTWEGSRFEGIDFRFEFFEISPQFEVGTRVWGAGMCFSDCRFLGRSIRLNICDMNSYPALDILDVSPDAQGLGLRLENCAFLLEEQDTGEVCPDPLYCDAALTTTNSTVSAEGCFFMEIADGVHGDFWGPDAITRHGMVHGVNGSLCLNDIRFHDLVGSANDFPDEDYNASAVMVRSATLEMNRTTVENCSGGRRAAVNANNSHLIVRDCIFRNNSALEGGALRQDQADGLIIDTWFEENHSGDPSQGDGLVLHASSPMVKRCEFLSHGNWAVTIRVDDPEYYAVAKVEDCVFRSNQYGLLHHAQYHSGSHIRNCLFIGSGLSNVGAIALSSPPGAVTACRLDGLTVTNHSGFPGTSSPILIDGALSGTGDCRIENSILRNPAAYELSFADATGSLGFLGYLNIDGGAGAIDGDPGTVPVALVDMDPGFVDPQGVDSEREDFALRFDSPMLDTGNPDCEVAGENFSGYDFDWTRRDIGWHRAWKAKSVVVGLGESETLEGWFYSLPEDIFLYAPNLVIKPGSVIRMGSGGDEVIWFCSGGATIGTDDDQRVTLTVEPANQPHPATTYPDDDVRVTGMNFECQFEEISVQALDLTWLGEAGLWVSQADCSINYMNIWTNSHGNLAFQECSGIMENSMIQGDWGTEGVVFDFCEMGMKDCNLHSPLAETQLWFTNTVQDPDDADKIMGNRLSASTHPSVGPNSRCVFSAGSVLLLSLNRFENHGAFGLQVLSSALRMREGAFNTFHSSGNGDYAPVEIDAERSTLWLFCGYNCFIHPNIGAGAFITSHEGFTYVDWGHNFWGSSESDTYQEPYVQARVPSGVDLQPMHPECPDPAYYPGTCETDDDEAFYDAYEEEVFGDKDTAIAMYKTFLETYPKSPYVPEVNARLKKLGTKGRNPGAGYALLEAAASNAEETPLTAFRQECAGRVVQALTLDRPSAEARLEEMIEEAPGAPEAAAAEVALLEIEALADPDGGTSAAGEAAEGAPGRRLSPRENLNRRLALLQASAGVGEDLLNEARPVRFRLGPAYPNPFNPLCRIPYRLEGEQKIRLSVHNLLGQEVALLQSGVYPSGEYEAVFDASALAGGIYFARLEGAGGTQCAKLLLIK